MQRRTFLAVTALSAAGPLPAGAQKLGVWTTLGALEEKDGAAPIEGARWYEAEKPGDGMAFTFRPGLLERARAITTDMLIDGRDVIAFQITLSEGEKGRRFRFMFGGLPQCSFRVRMDLSLVDQNRWMADREGAFLKPLCGGDRVDLALVDRLAFTVLRKAPRRARWCMTELVFLPKMPEKLAAPLLPKGPLIDEFGQSALHEWPGRTRSAEELKQRLTVQLQLAPVQKWPETFSRWGGWKARRLGEPTGFFTVRKEGGRWWLADPDGYAFWSAGPDCVRVDCEARVDGLETALKWLPEKPEYADAWMEGRPGRANARFVNFLAANFIRVFGREGWREKWAAIALAELRRLRFNTVANWSEWEFAARASFPYVRPLNFRGARSGAIYRDFPDVFHPGFEDDAAEYARQLESTAKDPAFLGYFLMNEPTWGFSSELPAAGMLYTTDLCHTREELARWLGRKYETSAALAKAWAMETTFEQVARGRWRKPLSKESQADLREFSVRMVDRYFSTISRACRKADPNHLNLGMRWAGVPPEWAVQGMKSFDVFSLNNYREKLPREVSDKIHAMLGMPVLVGEWHFGALDAGLPASGLGHVKTQADRGRAYRVYLEDAAANPNCVGAHWFTLYDQSALGRFDGENYNIGFLDICNRPYPEIGEAAIASHERMYQVAAGEAAPFADAPEYLPILSV